jgi:hypothetical protein
MEGGGDHTVNPDMHPAAAKSAASERLDRQRQGQNSGERRKACDNRPVSHHAQLPRYTRRGPEHAALPSPPQWAPDQTFILR